MTGEWSGGKGSVPRKVDRRAFASNFDRIFRKSYPMPEPWASLLKPKKPKKPKKRKEPRRGGRRRKA